MNETTTQYLSRLPSKKLLLSHGQIHTYTDTADKEQQFPSLYAVILSF